MVDPDSCCAVAGTDWERDGGDGAVGLDGCGVGGRRVRWGSAFWMGTPDGDGKSVGDRPQRADLARCCSQNAIVAGPFFIVADPYFDCCNPSKTLLQGPQKL